MNFESYDLSLLEKFITTNKEVIRLKELAFQIKLKSLNEQILSIRFDMQESGFQVVSRELIQFSNSFELLAREMLDVMSQMFPVISGQLKIMRMKKIKERALSLIKNSYSQDIILKRMNKSMDKQKLAKQEALLKNLLRIIAKTESLSLQGNVIFLQSKITGAYAKNTVSSGELNVLTEELGKDIMQIRNCVHRIKNVWETNS
jgi:hypothetical protein